MPVPAETSPPQPGSGAPQAVYVALRVLGIVVLVLMLVSIVYSGWISIENWGSIRV